MKKAKVAAIVQTGSGVVDPSSYNVQAIGQAKGMMELGWDIHYFANFKNIVKPTVLYKTPTNQLLATPVKGAKIFKEIVYFPGLIKKIVRFPYDFVQVGGDSQLMTPLILKACKRARLKTVLVQGMYRNYAGYKQLLQKGFDLIFKKKIIQNTDNVFAKTTMARDYLINKGYPNVHIFPIGLGAPQSNENNCLNDLVSEFKSKFIFTLLYIGKIEPRRNPEFLIEVFSILRQDNLSVGLIMVGDGPLSLKVRQQIDRKGLSDSVLLLKHVENAETHILYKNSDLFLLPSSYEIYGMVVMEALYWGCPVIATPEAGPATILTKPLYGSCIDLSPQKWAINISEFLNKRPRTIDEKKQRSEYIKSDYCWRAISKSFLRLIDVKMK